MGLTRSDQASSSYIHSSIKQAKLELNPSERLWSPLRKSVANRLFEQIEEMEEALSEEMKDLSEQKEYLSGLTNYHWLPST
jgi:hypothetical protein